MSKLLFSLGIILGGLALGYLIQQAVNSGRLKLPLELSQLRKLLQKSALLFVLPFTMLAAVWIIDFPSARLIALPFICAGALLLGGSLAYVYARITRMDRRKTGAFIPCGGFTNIGSIGALVVYTFLGEKGFAFLPIYKILEETIYYTLGFPIARSFSPESEGETGLSGFRRVFKDPFIPAVLTGIIGGALLNVSGLERPLFFETLNSVLIPLGAILLLTSIGLAMRFKSVGNYLPECFFVAGLKFLIIPGSMTGIAYLLGFGAIENGLPLKVVLILSSMPTAFIALVPPSLYDLELDLANACWLFTTASLVVTLPVLYVLLGLF